MKLELQLSNVTKLYGDKAVYKELNYTFKNGCYIIQGQNGIGKSVLLSMIAGVTPLDQGEIILSDSAHLTTRDYKSNMAYIPSDPSFFPMLAGKEFLSFINSVKSVPKASNQLSEYITHFELSDHMETKFDQMSLGTQKKLFLCTLAFGENKIILLDEPTNALDETSISFLVKKIKQYSKNSILIIATHDNRFSSLINHTAINLRNAPICKFVVSSSEESKNA